MINEIVFSFQYLNIFVISYYRKTCSIMHVMQQLWLHWVTIIPRQFHLSIKLAGNSIFDGIIPLTSNIITTQHIFNLCVVRGQRFSDPTFYLVLRSYFLFYVSKPHLVIIWEILSIRWGKKCIIRDGHFWYIDTLRWRE